MTLHETDDSVNMYSGEKAAADAKYWGDLCRNENAIIREQYTSTLAILSSRLFPSSRGRNTPNGIISLSNRIADLDFLRRYASNTQIIVKDLETVTNDSEHEHQRDVAHLLMIGAKLEMYDQLHLLLDQARKQGVGHLFDNLGEILPTFLLDNIRYPHNLIAMRDQSFDAQVALLNMIVETIIDSMSREYIVDIFKNRIVVDSKTPGRDFHNMSGSYIFVAGLINPYTPAWQIVRAISERKGVSKDLRSSARAILKFYDTFRHRMHEIFNAMYDPESDQPLAQAVFAIFNTIPPNCLRPLLLSICQNYSYIYALGHNVFRQTHPFNEILCDVIFDILDEVEEEDAEMHIPDDNEIDQFYTNVSVLKLSANNHLVHIKPELLPTLLDGTGISVPNYFAFSGHHNHIAINLTFNKTHDDKGVSMYVNISDDGRPFVSPNCLPSERADELTKALEIVICRIAQDPMKYLTTLEQEAQKALATQRAEDKKEKRRLRNQEIRIDGTTEDSLINNDAKTDRTHTRDEELRAALEEVRLTFTRRQNQSFSQIPSIEEISERSSIQHKLHFTDDPKALLASVSDGLSRDEISEVYERIQGYTGYGSVPGVEYKTFTLKESRVVFHELKFRIHDGVPIRVFLRQIASKQGEIFFEIVKVVRRKDVNLRGKHKRLQYL